jgi:hypothetical protein
MDGLDVVAVGLNGLGSAVFPTSAFPAKEAP